MARATGAYSSSNKHAVVIGGSMAGLLAARVLADHFEQVTVVERDRFPDGPEFRKGVPQSYHAHVLLGRGWNILERLFPTLAEDLTAAGGMEIDVLKDMKLYLRTGWGPRYAAGLTSFLCSRVLLEWGVRKHLAAHANVRFIEGCDVTGLLPDAMGTDVAGVYVRHRDRAADAPAGPEELRADLVVDASGRGSHTPEWLAALGYPPPAETTINSFLGYASRIYAPPPGFSADWKILFLQGRPPEIPRGGAIFTLEGNRWLVTLAGAMRDYPPTDDAGFMEFSRTLVDPALYQAIKDAEPLTPIHGYQRTANQLRHYEHMQRWPERLIALGDAACAFNPIYGQGMTTAAISALTLDAGLRAGAHAGMARQFQRQQAKDFEPAWLLATGEDFRYPGTEGGKRTPIMRMMHWYFDQIIPMMTENARMYTVFGEVLQMLKPPTALFHPGFVAAVLTRVATQRRKGADAAPVPDGSATITR